jgi:hypothetical protein
VRESPQGGDDSVILLAKDSRKPAPLREFLAAAMHMRWCNECTIIASTSACAGAGALGIDSAQRLIARVVASMSSIERSNVLHKTYAPVDIEAVRSEEGMEGRQITPF